MKSFIITILCGLAAVCNAADPVATVPQPVRSLPERVKDFLGSEWTELSIITALGSDDGRILATVVRLKRETSKSPVYYSLPLGGAAAEKATVNEKDLQKLYEDVLSVAKTMFAHQYPMEIYNSLSPEKARQMVLSGALKIVPTDVELLIIRGKNANGEVTLDETGPYSPLDTTIQTLFHTKQTEVKKEEYQAILGMDPYAEGEAGGLHVTPLHTMSDSQPLLIYPIPSLVSTLLNREQAKGSPLTEEEVIEIRNNCQAVAVPADVAEKIDAERGYKDIDPERCWEQWQEARKNF